jgi:hypothetical protein
MKNGTCKLCGTQNVDLAKQSHIIPEMMYESEVYKNGRSNAFAISTKPVKKPAKRTLSRKFIQTGPFEPDLFCLECENELIGAKLEGYASNCLFKNPKLFQIPNDEFIKFYSPDSIEYISCSKIDSKLFTQFLLSILLRASISSHPMFENINLKEQNDILRDVVLEKNINSDWTCVMHMLDIRETGTSDLLYVIPNNLAFVIGRYIVQFNKKALIPQPFQQFIIQTSERVKIVTWCAHEWNNYIHQLTEDMVRVTLDNMSAEERESYKSGARSVLPRRYRT